MLLQSGITLFSWRVIVPSNSQSFLANPDLCLCFEQASTLDFWIQFFNIVPSLFTLASAIIALVDHWTKLPSVIASTSSSTSSSSESDGNGFLQV